MVNFLMREGLVVVASGLGQSHEDAIFWLTDLRVRRGERFLISVDQMPNNFC
jgi:hypothetical protein